MAVGKGSIKRASNAAKAKTTAVQSEVKTETTDNAEVKEIKTEAADNAEVNETKTETAKTAPKKTAAKTTKKTAAKTTATKRTPQKNNSGKRDSQDRKQRKNLRAC